MKFLKTLAEKIQNNTLRSTTWICDQPATHEAEYYKLIFVSDTKVEGWVLFTNETKESHTFTATYTTSKNTIQFKKGEDCFVANYTKRRLVALVEGNSLHFKKILD